MEDKNQQTVLPSSNTSDSGPIASDSLHVPPSYDQYSLSGVPLQEAGLAESPQKINRFADFLKRPEIIMVILVILASIGVGAALAIRSVSTTDPATSNRFDNIKIPLDEILNGKNLDFEESSKVTINGQAQFNGSLTIAPSVQPTGAQAGQIYYDQDVNQLAYYNGQNFVFLSGEGPIQGVGAGFTLVNGQLSNGGVLSLQGQTGAVALVGGSGIGINGTTIINDGVISVAAGSANLTVTTDAAGNVVITHNAAGSGTVASPGGTAGAIAKFTGVQTIADSLLSEAGSTVTVGGNLNLTSGNQFRINGTQISSANLSNDSNLAKLNATQTFTGDNSFNGSLVLGDAAVDLITFNGVIQGSSPLVFEGTGPDDASETTFAITNPSTDRTVTFGDESGTVCLQGSLNCGFALGTSASYIQNQNAAQQPASNFWISGTGRADAALQAPLLDTAAAGTLSLGTTNATAINLNQSTSVAATKNLTVTSGLTSLTGNTTGDALNVSNSTSTGNIAVFSDNATAVLTLADGGAATFRNQTNAFGGFLVQDSSGNGIIRVDTTSRKVGIGLHPTSTSDNMVGQLQVSPTNDARVGIQVRSTFVSYSANFFEAIDSTTAQVFRVTSAGSVQNANGTFGSLPQTAASTSSANSAFGSGVVSGATSNSGTATFGSGNSTTSGNTGTTTLGSGNATSGNSGNVVIDAGTASGTTGTISIGTANASGLTLGRAVTAFTLQGSSASTLTASSGGFTTTVAFAAPGANHTVTIPNATGTVCLQSATACGFAAGTSASYIQNQNAAQQAASNFWISGNGRADTALQAPLLDTATSVALAIGTTNATAINLNQNTAIAATKTLTVTSGLTSLTSNTTGDALNVSNSTSTGNIAVFKDNTTNVATIADGGAVTLANSVNSSGAFNIQNAANGNILSVGTLGEPNNQITNGSIEVNTTNWAGLGSATVSRVTTQRFFGVASLETVTTATVGDGWKYNVTLSPSTTYTASFSAKLSSGTFTNMAFGYSSDGTTGGETDCKTSQQLATNGWKIFNCTFTTAASVTGTPYFYMKQPTGVLRTVWVDGFHLVPGSDIGAYYEGTLSTTAAVTSNFAIQSAADGQATFQVQSSTGLTVLTADTANARVGVGMSLPRGALSVASTFASDVTLILQVSGTQTADLFQMRDINQAVYTKIDKDGNLTVKPVAGTALAFDVQNTSGTSVFSADAAGVRINIGSSVADATGVILVLDTKNTSGDPTGVNGAMYYNSAMGGFRCYEDGFWRFCNESRSQSRGYRIDEDFWGNNDSPPTIGTHGWDEDFSGTGVTDIYSGSEDGHPGIRIMGTGTTATGRIAITLGDKTGNANPYANVVIRGGEVIEAGVKFPILYSGTETYAFRVGLGDSPSGEFTDGVYFEYDGATSATWRMGTANSGVRTEVTSTNASCGAGGSTVTVVASTWYNLKAIVNSAGTQVDFYINGTFVGCNTANIPSGTTDKASPIFQIVKTGTGTTAREAYADYFSVYNNFSSLR